MHAIHIITFYNGTEVPTRDKATRLGGVIARRSEYKPELNHRIAATAMVLKKLNMLWLQAPINTNCKHKVLDVVCVAKLTYGLETIPVTPEVCRKLDIFYHRALRKITGERHPMSRG